MDKFTIESNLFDVIVELNNTFKCRQKDKYKLYLVTLDELNEEYKLKTGNYYIPPAVTLNYYEKLWQM